MKYAAVIFDLFGTLVESFSVRRHEAVLAAMAAAMDVVAEDFRRAWVEGARLRMTGAFGRGERAVEANVSGVCAGIGIAPTDDQVLQAAAIRLEFTRNCLVPRADAIETLRRLRGARLKTAVLSDCTAEVPLLWPTTPFDGLFDATVFSCLVGMKKPEAAIYQIACERLGVRPEECLYVGDGSSHELTGAAAAGMDPVLIRVPQEDTYDPHRMDVEDWHGPTIQALAEVGQYIV